MPRLVDDTFLRGFDSRLRRARLRERLDLWILSLACAAAYTAPIDLLFVHDWPCMLALTVALAFVIVRRAK